MDFDFAHLYDGNITDGHIHFWGGEDLAMAAERVTTVMDRAAAHRFNAVVTLDPHSANGNSQGIYLKARFPERAYLFGGLDHLSTMGQRVEVVAANLANQVDRLRSVGCDGIKMIETKPTVYKRLPIPLDGPVYTGFFARLEATGFPVVMHVNDPQAFWDPDLIPSWARERGWFYGDGSFPANDDLYGQVTRVLERHPKLRIIFAHFYFLGGDLERAVALLDRYENVHLDLTPGSEMYYQLSADPQAARAFFLRYQDRIIFGTDTSDRALETEEGTRRTLAKFWLVRHFLETDEAFDSEPLIQRPGTVRGIALPERVLAKIYEANFQRLAGIDPAPLDSSSAIAECERLGDLFDRSSATSAHLAAGIPRPTANVPRQVAKFLSRNA